MDELRDIFAEYFLPPDGSIEAFCRSQNTKTLREAIAAYRLAPSERFEVNGTLRAITSKFRGETTEEDEDAALALLLGTSRPDELIYYINNLTWDGLDDDLDEADLTQILARVRQLLDHRDYRAAFLLRWFFLVEAASLPNRGVNDLTAVAQASGAVYSGFADRTINQRDRILDDIASMALRRQPTYVGEFRIPLNVIAATGLYRPVEMLQLSWEVFYTELICDGLARGEFRQLLSTLPDLVDQQLLPVRRSALFDMLRRWDRHFVAMDQLLKDVGSGRQQSDMRRFMDTRRVFMANFPPALAPAGALQQAVQAILSALNTVGTGLDDLKNAIQDLATSLGNVSVASVLGTASDDIARNAANRLSQQQLVPYLPSDYKVELINRMLSGFGVDDDDEQAILTVLTLTKQHSVAEFAQIAASATWEALDSNFDGTEYDSLEKLFQF